MPFAATWMQLGIIILSEISQKERQMTYDITYRWNLKYDTRPSLSVQLRLHASNAGGMGLIAVWRRQWHPTPLLLPGKSHGQRSLEGCSPWGR